MEKEPWEKFYIKTIWETEKKVVNNMGCVPDYLITKCSFSIRIVAYSHDLAIGDDIAIPPEKKLKKRKMVTNFFIDFASF